VRRKTRLEVTTLLGSVTLVNLSYTVLIPFVPYYQDEVGASPVEIGLMFALFAAAKALCQPLGGWLVDRSDARVVVLAGELLVALSVVGFALSDTVAALLLTRIAWGAGEGLITPALLRCATAIDGVPPGRVMGWFGTAAVTGLLIGPIIAGLAGAGGPLPVFLGGAAGVVLAAGVSYACLPRTRAVELATPAMAPAVTVGPAAAVTSRSRAPWVHLAIVFGVIDLVTNALYSSLEPTLPLYLGSGGTGRDAVGLVFAGGLAAFGVVSWLLGRRTEAVPATTLIRTGLLIGVVAFCALALDNRLGFVAVAFVAIMVSQAMLYIGARRGITDRQLAGAVQGRCFGVFGAISDIGNVAGPIMGALVYSHAGGQAAPLAAAALAGATWVALRLGWLGAGPPVSPPALSAVLRPGAGSRS